MRSPILLSLLLVFAFNGCQCEKNSPYEDDDFDGWSEIDGDCDDEDYSVSPFAPEICDEKDNDCDGLVDEAVTCGACTLIDQDFDGVTNCDGDCNDQDSLVSPFVPEFCDGKDNNCDGFVDEGYADVDEDQDGVPACGDCDDADSSAYPGAPELCDGLDNNCDFIADEGFVDQDADGVPACAGDCDDTNPNLGSGSEEVCDGVDNDCDGQSDDGFDNDNDGFTTCNGDCNDASAAFSPDQPELLDGLDNDCDGEADQPFTDSDGDGLSEVEGDCDDSSSQNHPGAPEVCDSVDNDCDALVDEGFDIDRDTVTSCGGDCNDNNATIAPGKPERLDGLDNDCDFLIDEDFFDDDGDGSTEAEGDCNDSSPMGGPGAAEVCDGVDNNCSGQIDEGFDNDNDGASTCAGDCNDANPNLAPGKPELQDGLDNNCNGQIDENFNDNDGDGSTEEEGDCDDNEPLANPDAIEVEGDNEDNDCDGLVDEPLLPCDSATLNSSNALHYAKAIGLCHGEVISAELVGSFPLGRAIVTSFGSNNGALNRPIEGVRMVHLSSGRADTGTHDTGTSYDGTGGCIPIPHPDPQEDPPGSCAFADPETVCDKTELSLLIKVPSNANAFSYRFQFFSSEYPTFRCSDFDDTFLALLQSQSFTGNISFDNSGNVVSVNNGFFDICIDDLNNINGGPPNDCSIESGAALANTGYIFDNDPSVTGSGSEGAGATVPLVTTAPVTPGETILLRFMIFDEGDSILDSSVLLDGFTWELQPISQPVTTPDL